MWTMYDLWVYVYYKTHVDISNVPFNRDHPSTRYTCTIHEQKNNHLA